MATCKNIIVTIADFDPLRIYYIYVRRESDPTYDMSSYNQTVSGTNPTTIKDLSPSYQYEIGISVLCGKTEKSPINWLPVSAGSCAPPPVSVIFNNGTSTFTITLPSGTVDFEWRVDEEPWVKITSDTNAVRTLTFAQMQMALQYPSGYGTDPDIVFRFQVRMHCASNSKSAIAQVTYIKDPTSEARVDLMKDLCVNGVHVGQLIRVTMAVKSAAGGSETVVYDSPSAAAITLAEWTRTIGASPETEIALAEAVLNGFDRKIVINPNPDLRSASIDFISTVPPEGMQPGQPIPCNAYPFYHSIV